MSGSDLITVEIDGSAGDTGTVDSSFKKQSDGTWYAAYTDPSTSYCKAYDPGKHTVALLDQDSNVIVEGSLTLNP